MGEAAEIEGGLRPGAKSAEAQRIAALEREKREPFHGFDNLPGARTERNPFKTPPLY